MSVVVVKSSVVAELKDLLMPLKGFHEDSRHLMNRCRRKLVVAGDVGRDNELDVFAAVVVVVALLPTGEEPF